MRTAKIIKSFGSWAVTRYGVESTTTLYPISKDRVHEENSHGYTWEKHMSQKNWVKMNEFNDAIRYARELWPEQKSVGL
jgi:hypothetical protein